MTDDPKMRERATASACPKCGGPTVLACVKRCKETIAESMAGLNKRPAAGVLDEIVEMLNPFAGMMHGEDCPARLCEDGDCECPTIAADEAKGCDYGEKVHETLAICDCCTGPIQEVLALIAKQSPAAEPCAGPALMAGPVTFTFSAPRTSDAWPAPRQAEWDVMILGWARAQAEAFTILDVMRRLFGPDWVAQTPEHYLVSTALHRLPKEGFTFSAPIPQPGGVCTPTWTPVRASGDAQTVTQPVRHTVAGILSVTIPAERYDALIQAIGTTKLPEREPAPWNDPRRFWCDECASARGVDRAVEAAYEMGRRSEAAKPDEGIVQRQAADITRLYGETNELRKQRDEWKQRCTNLLDLRLAAEEKPRTAEDQPWEAWARAGWVAEDQLRKQIKEHLRINTELTRRCAAAEAMVRERAPATCDESTTDLSHGVRYHCAEPRFPRHTTHTAAKDDGTLYVWRVSPREAPPETGPNASPAGFPVRTCKTCGYKTCSTSTVDFCTKCRDSDGLRPKHFLTRDEEFICNCGCGGVNRCRAEAASLSSSVAEKKLARISQIVNWSPLSNDHQKLIEIIAVLDGSDTLKGSVT